MIASLYCERELGHTADEVCSFMLTAASRRPAQLPMQVALDLTLPAIGR